MRLGCCGAAVPVCDLNRVDGGGCDNVLQMGSGPIRYSGIDAICSD